QPPFNVRKHQRFQGAALGGVGEYPNTELLAVHGLRRVENLPPPAADDLLADIGLSQRLVPELVGGDDSATVPGELRGDQALAAADAADQAEDGLSVHSTSMR